MVGRVNQGGQTRIFRTLALVFCLVWLPNSAAAAVQVAIFPLQELEDGRHDANLPLTEMLADKLTAIGNDITDVNTVIAFMANYRIRIVGSLETFDFSRVKLDLGVPFVLLGTITQRKTYPTPSLGLTLNLVRTSDARTLWSYTGSFNTSSERRVLGINEPQTTEDLQDLLLDEISVQWPWEIVEAPQPGGSIKIDSSMLYPQYVRTGDEIYTQVRLRDISLGPQAPRIYFKALDQLYPATVSLDGVTYKSTWFAGENDGRIPVNLLLEWPEYGRSEESLLGTYIVDNTAPLFEIELKGSAVHEDITVFRNQVEIIPRPLIHKPVARWRLAFYDEQTIKVGEMTGTGRLPPRFVWKGAGNSEKVVQDGVYQVVIDAWDKAGNFATASRMVEKDQRISEVNLVADKSEKGMVVDLSLNGPVPLAFWRLELWTREGRLLTQSTGKELPVQFDLDIPEAEQNENIEGFLFYQDVLGKQVRKKLKNLFPDDDKELVKKKKKRATISVEWVDEF